MKRMILFFFALLTISMVSCEKDDDVEVIQMRINHYQVPVDYAEAYIGMAYLVQDDDQMDMDDWDIFAANIDGFDYEMGYVYDVVVKKETIDNPPIDGASSRYTLLNVLSKEPVPDDTTFDFTLAIVYSNGYGTYLRKDESGNYSLLSDITIDCGNLKEELDNYLEQEVGLVGTFEHETNDSIKLISLETQD